MRSLFYSSCGHILAISIDKLILFERAEGEGLSAWGESLCFVHGI